MNRPSNEEQRPDDLLGYVLGALDADEQEQIEQRVGQDDAISHEINQVKIQVAPLDGLAPPGPPPAGLARRTCERIANLPAKPASETKPRWFSAQDLSPNGNSSWSLSDFITVAVVALVLSVILLPAVNHSRYQSRVLMCQDNLRQVGFGMFQFAENSNNKFIAIPAEGNRAVAGCYAPTLCESGYIDNPNLFLCAGLGMTGDRELPSCQEIDRARGLELIEIQKRMGGDYAYSLGYSDDGRYIPPINRMRANHVLLADAPSNRFPGRASNNHSGGGQNCLFEDGHVAFWSTCEVDGDSIYENDFGNIAPGAHVSDIVVAPSYTRLMGTE